MLNYEYGMLVDVLIGKCMLLMCVYICVCLVDDFFDYICYFGEEFVFVLGGEIELCFENGDVFCLVFGDSLYFDSVVGYVYLLVSKEDVEIFVCCIGIDVCEFGDVI